MREITPWSCLLDRLCFPQDDHYPFGLALMPKRIPVFLHKLFSVPELAAASDYCLTYDGLLVGIHAFRLSLLC